MEQHSNATHTVGGLPPPPGVIPNFVNPESLHGEWLLTLTMCLIFPTILVFLRMYTKIILIKSHGWEDYTSFIAWLGSIGYLAIDFVAFSNGAGIHQWNVPIEQVRIYAQAVNAKEIFNGPVIYFVKLSIMLQFMRIFVPLKTGTAYYVIQFVNWLNFLYYSAYTLTAIFYCTPRKKIWEPQTPGHCVNISALLIASSLINITSDIAMLMIPLFCISALQMQLKRKIGISIIFATGIFACITSILRSVSTFRIVGKHDLTYELIPLAFWSDAEIASGIICGCMPVMPQLVRHLAPIIKSQFSTYISSSRKGGSAASKPPPALDPVSPWDDVGDMDDDSRNLKGNNIEMDVHSIDYPSVELGGPMKVHARGISRGSISRHDAHDLENGPR